MVVCLEIETWVVGKSGAKGECEMGVGVGGRRGMGSGGVLGPCVCLDVVLLL
jgi:hypothetical protein